MEQPVFESSPAEHRPGVAIFDRSGFQIVDVDSGTVRLLASTPDQVDGFAPASEPEFQAHPGRVPDPVSFAAMTRAEEVPLDRALLLNGPVAARVDKSRVLLWDDVARCYVECSQVHLKVLIMARTGVVYSSLIEGQGGSSLGHAAAQLVALGVLDVVDPLEMISGKGSEEVEHSGSRSGSDTSDEELLRSIRIDALTEKFASLSKTPVIPLYRWSSMSTDDDCGEMIEPSLSIGVLMASARSYQGGRLGEIYDLWKLKPYAAEVLTAWERQPVPAVFVFSDYLWNVDRHLAMSKRIKELSPTSICLHGGPSVPKHQRDAERFLAEHPYVDVAVRGEGEWTFCEILSALGGELSPDCLDRLDGVNGLTFATRRSGQLEYFRTPERPRMTSVDEVPSPYLTGEFDDLLSVKWRSASLETNRGCPYGCTFCDWGSSTLSRIRKFDLDRVKAEFDWIAEKAGPSEIFITDANYGIFARDVEITEHIASLRRRVGFPYAVVFNLAKNTTKYSKQIVEIMVNSDVHPIVASSAVQTHDEATLEIVRRQNIKTEKYDELAEKFAEIGLPLATDLLVGLPGATVETFKTDLQECFDREVTPRAMEIILLPNSPMNDPEYREEYEIVSDERNVVVGTSSYTRSDYDRMLRLRLIFRGADHFGVLRHTLRVLQWDYGLRAADVLDSLDAAITQRGNRFPLLAFFGRVFDLYTMPPVSWAGFFEEFREFLAETYGIEAGDDLRSTMMAEEALLPSRTRSYPLEVELPCDVVAYRKERVHSVTAAHGTVGPHRRLKEFGSAVLVVDDPLQVGREYIRRNHFPRRRTESQNLFYMGYDWELSSPLCRFLATNIGRYESSAV